MATNDPVLHALIDLCRQIENEGPLRLEYEHAMKVIRERTAPSGEVRPEGRLIEAQRLLSAMMNITAHWHSNPAECSKCETVGKVVAFLQETGYGPERSEPQNGIGK